MTAVVEEQTAVRCPHCTLVQFEKPGRVSCVRCRAALYRVKPALEVDKEPEPAEVSTRKPFFGAIKEDEEPLLKLVLNELKAERKRQRISQRVMGLKSKQRRTHISRIENGRRKASTKMLIRMGEALGLNFARLLLKLEPEVAAPIQWLPDPLSEIMELLPKLNAGQKALIMGAARRLAEGQYTFPEWINI